MQAPQPYPTEQNRPCEEEARKSVILKHVTLSRLTVPRVGVEDIALCPDVRDLFTLQRTSGKRCRPTIMHQG